MYYIPATKSGYFNTMNVFTARSTFVWGMDAYFDAGGAGRLDTTGGGGVPANTVNFTYGSCSMEPGYCNCRFRYSCSRIIGHGTNPFKFNSSCTPGTELRRGTKR